MPLPFCHLQTAHLEYKRVFVRADINVPFTKKNKAFNDFRLQNLLPTLQLIKEKKGRSIVCSHLGRPEGFDPVLSLKQFVPWFEQQGFKTLFAQNPSVAISISKQTDYDLILLENIRFFPGEEACDTFFAQELAATADYYVNDAFGSCHRTSASLTVMPQLFAPEARSIGLLVEKELEYLTPLRTSPKKPFVIMIGGIKGKTKIPLLHALLPVTNAILITTPLCFTFFKAQGKEIGKSYFEADMIHTAHTLIEEAARRNVMLLFPTDFQVTTGSFEEPKKIRLAKTITPDDTGISIGPDTTKLYKHLLNQAKTIFINGLPGNPLYGETLEGTRILLSNLQSFSGNCIIGGGDSVALVEQLGFHDVGYLSTGGGATLAYLSKGTLPALEMFTQ